MNRRFLEAELKKAGVTLEGWEAMLACDRCKQRWRPFTVVDGCSGCAVQPDYWKCPRGCNAAVGVNPQIENPAAEYVVISDIPGVVFAADDLREFEIFVKSIDNTEVWNKE